MTDKKAKAAESKKTEEAPKVEEPVKATSKKNTAFEKEQKDVDEGFDVEAYETYTKLSFEKKLRKKETLTEPEQEKLEKAKKPALSNKGKKALVTDTFRVKMTTVRLMEGVPTPPSVVGLFPENAQKRLFE